MRCVRIAAVKNVIIAPLHESRKCGARRERADGVKSIRRSMEVIYRNEEGKNEFRFDVRGARIAVSARHSSKTFCQTAYLELPLPLPLHPSNPVKPVVITCIFLDHNYTSVRWLSRFNSVDLKCHLSPLRKTTVGRGRGRASQIKMFASIARSPLLRLRASLRISPHLNQVSCDNRNR